VNRDRIKDRAIGHAFALLRRAAASRGVYDEAMVQRILAVAVLAGLLWAVPLLAQAPAGTATYRVTIMLTRKYDLFKDKDGNIHVKPKKDKGPGEPTGYNITDFFRDVFKKNQ
jgi:hypothetical protein